MAAPSLGKPMCVIINLESIKAQTMGRAKDFEKRGTLASTMYRLCARVWQRLSRKYVFQNIANDLKLTFI
jgi:hypothetical protein